MHEEPFSGCHILLVPHPLRSFWLCLLLGILRGGGGLGTRNKCSCEVVLTAVLLAPNLRNPLPGPQCYNKQQQRVLGGRKQTLLRRKIRFGRQNS
jgi:hypothetical protein